MEFDYLRIGGWIGIVTGGLTALASWFLCLVNFGFMGFLLGWIPSALLGAVVGWIMMYVWAPVLVIGALAALAAASHRDAASSQDWKAPAAAAQPLSPPPQ